nr:hypothetical protein Itr_chr12CG26980 [Ipomoea trifida]
MTFVFTDIANEIGSLLRFVINIVLQLPSITRNPQPQGRIMEAQILQTPMRSQLHPLHILAPILRHAVQQQHRLHLVGNVDSGTLQHFRHGPHTKYVLIDRHVGLHFVVAVTSEEIHFPAHSSKIEVAFEGVHDRLRGGEI